MKKFKKHKKYLIPILVILIYFPLAAFIFAPKQSTQVDKSNLKKVLGKILTPTPTSIVPGIKTKANEVIHLPVDEEPVIATVTDPALLSNQEFFQQAKEGDKILIYQSIKIAVLYRPSTEEVITYAKVIYGLTPSPSIDPSASPSPIPAKSKLNRKLQAPSQT